MQDGYLKFKKKIMLEVLIKSLSFSIALGLIVFSSPLIYFKLKEIKFNLLYLILISVGVIVLSFIIIYLILKPSEKKIAKRIDKQLDLNEKVQTMYEYKDSEGVIVNIQRENTLSILSNTSIKKLSMKFSVFLIAFLFIACGACVTALALPTEKEDVVITPEPEEPEDPPYDADDWTKKALIDLIKYVEEYEFNESLKTKYLDKLNYLLNNVDNLDTIDKMLEVVTGIIVYNAIELDKTNSNNEIYTILSKSDHLSIKLLAGQINLLNVEKVNNALDNIIITINGSLDALYELDPGFGELLRKSNLDKNDKLISLIFKLSEDLRACDKVPTNELNSAIKNVISKSSDAILAEIIDQKANFDINEYIANQLTIIFNLNAYKDDDDESEDKTPEDEEDENDKNQQGSQGGLGEGEIKVGSDDLFFDSEKGIVKYGEVIEVYYGLIAGQLEEGVIPEDVRVFFNTYFDKLFGDLKENEENKDLGE